MCWSNKSSVILFKTDVCSVINKGPDFKETTARSLYEAIYCCCESVSMFYKGMCHASVCMLVSVNTLLCVLFSCARAVRFSHHHFNGFRCLQESMCPTLPLIQRDTVRNLQKMTQIKPVVPHRKQKQSVTNILTGRTWKWLWDLREELKCKENSRE